VSALAFAADGKTLASAEGSPQAPQEVGTIKLWDLATGRERPLLLGHRCGVTCLAFLPDGRTFASGSFDETVKLWDLGPGKVPRSGVPRAGPDELERLAQPRLCPRAAPRYTLTARPRGRSSHGGERGPARGPGPRLAHGHARRREVPGGAVPPLAARAAVHPP